MKKIFIFLLFLSVFMRVSNGHEKIEDFEQIEDPDNEEQCVLNEEVILLRKRGPLKYK